MSSNYFAQFDEPEDQQAPADRAFDAPEERDPKLAQYADIFEAGIKQEKNKAIFESFNREVFAHPYFTVDDPSTVVGASLIQKPDNAVATDAVLPQVRRGVGIGTELFGKGVEQITGGAFGEGLQTFGQRQQDSAPDRKMPSVYDIRGLKDFGTWAWETSQEALGTAALPIGTALSLTPLGRTATIVGTTATSAVMGIGQVRNALEDERNEWFGRAMAARERGDVMAERLYEEEAAKFDPEKNSRIIYTAGTIIGMLDAASVVFAFNGAPVSLVNKTKAEAFRFVVAHLTKRAAEGAAIEGATEAAQAVAEMVGVAKARGVEGLFDHLANLNAQRYRLLEEGLAGAVGGATFNTLGASRDIVRGGASDEPPNPLMDQAKQQAGTGNFFEQFDTPEDKAAAQAPQQPAQPQQPQTAPTPAETSPSQPATTPAPATVDLTQGATEVVRTYGLPDDIVSGARLDNLYVRDAQLEEQLDLREVDLDLDVEMEDGTVTKQTVKMPARQALDMVDRRLKGMVAFIRCLES